MRIAVLFAWSPFHLKLDAGYFNAQDEDTDYLLPVIRLWWRFDG